MVKDKVHVLFAACPSNSITQEKVCFFLKVTKRTVFMKEKIIQFAKPNNYFV